MKEGKESQMHPKECQRQDGSGKQSNAQAVSLEGAEWIVTRRCARSMGWCKWGGVDEVLGCRGDGEVQGRQKRGWDA